MADVARLTIRITTDSSSAARSLARMNAMVNQAGSHIRRMNGDLGNLRTGLTRADQNVNRTTRSVTRMGGSARRSRRGVIGFVMSIGDLGRSAGTAAGDLLGLGSKATSLLGSLGSVSAIAAVAGAAISALGSLAVGAGALIAAALPVAIIAVGAAAIRTNKEVASAFGDLKRVVAKTMYDSALVLKGPLVSAMKLVSQTAQQMQPMFTKLFTAVAPFVKPLVQGILDLATKALPGLIAALNSSMPIVKGFAYFLGQMGKGIGLFFSQMTKNQGSVQGLSMALKVMGDGLASILGTLGAVIGQMAKSKTVVENLGLMFQLVAVSLKLFGSVAVAFAPVLKVLLLGLITVINGVAGASEYLQRVTATVWPKIKNAIVVAWGYVYRNVMLPIGRFFTQTIPRWTRMLRNAVVAAWNSMKNGISAAWNWVRNNVLGPVRRFFTQIIPAAARSMRNGVVNAWYSARNGIRAAWDSIYRNVITKIRTFFTKTIPGWAHTLRSRLVSSFNSAKNGIKNSWDKLKSIFKAPVKFLIDVVINKGIVGSANWLISKLGGGKHTIPKVGLPKGFATGGYTGNGGKYTPAGVVHKGEYVLNKSATSKIGVASLHHMNRTGNMPGYASGGFAGFNGPKKPKIKGVKGYFDDAKKSGISKALSLIPGLPGAALSGAFSSIKGIMSAAGNWIGGIKGSMGSMGSMFGPIFKGLVGKLWSVLKDVVKSVFEANQVSGNGYKAGPDWRGGDGQIVNYHGATMDAYTRRLLIRAEAIYGRLFSITQGSFSRGVSASAGTHDGGGVVDIGQTSNKAVGALRAAGFAAWARTPAEGFSPHTHAVAVKDKLLSSAARNQVGAFFKGRNGLANNGPDTYSAPGGGKGSSAGGLRAVVSRVLNELGQSQSNIGNVMRAIMKESGGNAHAINNWDSNAARGTPSKGLLQVIDPTFRAYAGPYRNRSIYDPYANIYAAINYARNRYGSGWSARMARPGGYANGGMTKPGWAMVGERGPEMVHFGGGQKVIPNKDLTNSGGITVVVNVGSTMASKRDIEDAVVTAIESARRKGRKV